MIKRQKKHSLQSGPLDLQKETICPTGVLARNVNSALMLFQINDNGAISHQLPIISFSSRYTIDGVFTTSESIHVHTSIVVIL